MLKSTTLKVLQGQDLSRRQAEECLNSILDRDCSDAAIASLLTALSLKGETASEIAGFAMAMRAHARLVPMDLAQLVDTAGTGGGAPSFNISTTAVFVIAGAGVPVAKHGNRAFTSRSGSADLLVELGVNIEAPPEVAQRTLEQQGLAFFFAPLFHPSMKRVAQIRQQLAHRTIFNLLGPLTNPAGAPHQLIGAYSIEAAERMANALVELDCQKAWVVHSDDGLDELSGNALSTVFSVSGSSIRRLRFNPQEFGLEGDSSGYPSGSPAENAQLARAILRNQIGGSARDVVLLNAAAAIHLASDCSLEKGMEQALDSLQSGAALEKLEALKRAYQPTPEEKA